MGIRSRDLPAFSTVPQPTTLPRAPINIQIKKLIVHLYVYIASGVGLCPLYCGHFWPIVPYMYISPIYVYILSRVWYVTRQINSRGSRI
jgi:hypothetical protein